MKKLFKVITLSLPSFLICFFICVNQTQASSIQSFVASLSASRPSASSPVTADVAASSGTAAIVNNGSIFLSSDSAKFWSEDQGVMTIATSSANKTTLFFTGTTGSRVYPKGTAITTAITAMHHIQFTTIATIPIGGQIIIKYPNSVATDTQVASPSAVTFMTNNLQTSNIQLKLSSGTGVCSWAVTASTTGAAPTLTCTVGTDAITGGTQVTILIGCTTAGLGCKPSDQRPTLINPTKTAATGTADTWSVMVETWNAPSGTLLDNGKTKLGTVESVTVIAHIEPTFTFVITGIGPNTALSTLCTNNPNTTTNTSASNPNVGATATEVNLGTVTAAATNYAAQTLKITSNAAVSGYIIYATSSGHFLNPANGVFIPNAQGDPVDNNSPAPVALTGAGTAQFGIHACDLISRVSSTIWGTATPKYANPSPNYFYTLVNSITEPAASGDTIAVEYAINVAGSTPPGDYYTTLTYMAAPIF